MSNNYYSMSDYFDELDAELMGFTSDDSGSDDELDDVVYEPEEICPTKFTISLCDKYDTQVHGPANESVQTHYLTYVRFKQLDMDTINDFKSDCPTLQLEITECIYLPSLHCVSIIKTIWLKLIQRKWKSICKQRKLCISMRSNPNVIKYKETKGYWPDYCSVYPRLNGILSNLPRTLTTST